MALNKSISLENGVTLNYHRISQITLGFEERETYPEVSEVVSDDKEVINETPVESIEVLRLYIEVASYVSQDVRISGAEKYVDISRYGYDITEEESETNLREVAYNKIKLEEKFLGSQDC